MRHLLIVWIAAAAAAQQPDPFAAVRVLEGKWEGMATGEPGKGVSAREYKFDLNAKFLVGRNRSIYEPKSAGARPEVHEDMGVISYDRASKKLVLRQFHGEGFVNEYVLESMAADGKSFEFVTVRIENIGPGWKAKEAYRVISAEEIEETFSLAGPGKDFEVYSRTRLKKKRN